MWYQESWNEDNSNNNSARSWHKDVSVFGTMTTHPPISISQCDICNVFGLTCVMTQDVTLLPCEARENVQPELMEQEIKVG